jgi:hypothetical protein
MVALAGSGAVAIWHDIAPEGRDEFYAWHGQEHMPERVSIPGFRRGRRYIAVHGSPEYFNLYETASHAVLTGRDYLERLNHPTPWTTSTVRHFRRVARSLCEVAATHGAGEGGLIATVQYDVPADAATGHRSSMMQRIEALASERGVAGAHFLIADTGASAVDTTERRARAEANQIPPWIVLVEWWGDESMLRERCARLVTEEVFAPACSPPSCSIYRLQNACGAASTLHA